MKVTVLICAAFLFLLETRAQINYVPVLVPAYNLSQLGWTHPTLNKTHWDPTALNQTHINVQNLNQTQWWQMMTLNKTHWNPTALNQTHINLNQTHWWQLMALNKTHPAPNITHSNVVPTPNSENRWVYNYTTQSGDVLVGHIVFRDRLLFNKTYSKDARWWSGREKTVEYPKDLKDSYYRHEIISAIRIYNRFYNGAHSTAEIVSGGVGLRYVKIRMSSSWGRGFKYEVQIFGH